MLFKTSILLSILSVISANPIAPSSEMVYSTSEVVYSSVASSEVVYPTATSEAVYSTAVPSGFWS